MKTKQYLITVLLSLFIGLNVNLNAQQVDCDPDVQPPSNISCNSLVYVSAAPDGTTITADMIVEGVTIDNCTASDDITYRLTLNPTGTLPPDETLFFPSGTTGVYNVTVYPVDEAGNWGNLCWGQIQIFDNPPACNDDTEAPVAICDEFTTVNLSINDEATLDAVIFDDGSYDNCTPGDELNFFVTLNNDTNPPADESITFTAEGNYIVYMWVVDEAGNANTCAVEVTVQDLLGDCADDDIAPIAVCDQVVNVSLSPDGEATIFAETFNDGSNDNCTPQNDLTFVTSLNLFPTPPATPSVTFTEVGVTIAYFWVIDLAGNFNTCAVEVHVENPFADCDNDTTNPVPYCHNDLIINAFPDEEFTLWATDLDAGSYDDCTLDNDLNFTIALGSPSTPPTTESLEFTAGDAGETTLSMWVTDAAGNYSYCETTILLILNQFVSGRVFLDENEDCVLDAGENPLENWQVQITAQPSGTSSTFWTTEDGYYAMIAENNGTDTEITVSLLAPTGLGTSCPTTYTLPLPLPEMENEINFPVQLTDDCQNMTVDVSTPFLRRCFENPYFATYCNYSTQPVDNVEVTIVLPPNMELLGSPDSYTNLGNSTFLFEVGTVAAGECGVILMNIYVSCLVELGETKCVEAQITPNDCDGLVNYVGARLQVTGECDDADGKVRFSIENIGDEDMQSALEYIVVEDVIMYMQTPISLPTGEAEVLEFDATGATWRVEVPQVEGVPSLSMPSSTVEGCGGLNTVGVVNVFSMDDADPYVSIDCQEVIGSYDPNDKRAFPTGYGEQHYIRQNEDIEYHIRFQNTGTDTAFTVRIEDQLSAHLDMYSVRPGASSHPYQMSLNETGLLTFTFNNILLPDSTTNEVASHGFVKFRVSQQADVALESIIENTADIYFDFNEAVITNTVFHTVGENFIEVINNTQDLAAGIGLTIAPNPFADVAVFTLEGADNQESTIFVYNVNGQIVQQFKFTNNQFEIHRNDLTSGMYFYKIESKETTLATGKLMVK